MEHYAHSLSKKTVFGSATHHKSVYDDVFGGPPKFGGPTLAPRYEDYEEIFSGFHSSSSSRGLSIPVLDLPIVDDETEEASFDVRSAWFDYSEVFGGYHDTDFAVSFEDLVRRFEGAIDYSSDDAWSPVQSGSFSDELDPSVCSTNADSSSCYIPADFTKFHTSYYKANQRTSGEIAVDIPEEPHLNDISGHDSYIGKTHFSQEQVEVEPPETVGSGDHETDDCDSEKTSRSFAQYSKSFVTINEISLRTKPSRIPPPSRPPPLFAVKKGTFGKGNLSPNDSNTCAFERGEGSHSPPFYDVEVDVNNTIYCRANSSMDDVTRGTHATESIFGIHSSSEEETIATEGRSTVFDGEKCGNKLPHKFKGTFAWRQETEYFEVVETGLPSEAVSQDKDGCISFPCRSDEYKKAGTVSSDLHNLDGEKNEQECLQETCISADQVRQSVALMGSSRVKDCQKKSSFDSNCDSVNLQDDRYEIVENVVKAHTTDSVNEDGISLWGTNADEIVMNIHEKNANARRRWKSFETESYHEISCKDVEQTVQEKPEARHGKSLNQNHEKGENETNPKKSCDGNKGDGNIKEANPYSEIDAKNRQTKMVLNLDKNEDHIEMAPAEFYEEIDTHVADVSLSTVTTDDCDENPIILAFDKNNIEGSLRVNNAPMARNEDAFNHEALGDYAILNLDQVTHMSMKSSNSEVHDNVNEEMHVTVSPQKLDNTRFGIHETTPASVLQAEDENMETIFQTKDQKLEEKSSDIAVEEDCGKTKKDLQPDNLETSTEHSCSNQPVTDSKQADIGIGTSSTESHSKAAPITHDPVKLDNNEEHGEKIIKGFRLNANKENAKNEHRSYQTSEVASSEKGSKNTEREERCANELLASEKRMRELRLHKEREFEMEKLRKLEEEREREREREKDRMAIDSSVIYGRQRSVSTRERLEKDSMEVRGASMEAARLRAERAAVEKATAEARQRAFAKTMSEKITIDVSGRVERSVSDKFSSSSRQFYESQKVPQQGAGTSSMLRYSYSSVNSGVESESPQRYKARLERYRRTAERAAKALAEKNTRDLIAQKELEERYRCAEYLDAEVKRWSSGKEGNLRALLSTLQYILGPESGWQPIPLTEVITTVAVKRAYRKATLCVHPDKLQQRGASIQHKYICEKVFDLLQEAWKTFTSEER